MRETTALGAAIAAGLAVGLWRNFTELRDINRAGGIVFEPKMTREESARLFVTWEKAVQMSRGWVEDGTKAKSPFSSERKKSSATNGATRYPSFTVEFSFDDLEEADEEDLLLELKKIEIQKRLKRLRRVRR